MRELYIADFLTEVKDVYGSYDILNQLEVEDMLGFIQFTRIVWNYTKMSKLNESTSPG